jgi:hypothetical protein
LVEYVQGLVVEGLTVLGGKPKLGKSWLVLNLAVAVAAGGMALGNPDRAVAKAGVLYLALEDGERRMKERLRMLGVDPFPENLFLVHEWPRLDSGGIQYLRHALDCHPEVRVVVIDTLGRIRGPRKRGDWYGEDYEVLGALHDLARERPGLAIIVVHHNRKDDAPADYVDALSGSTGIGGSPDVVAVLQRGRGEVDGVLAVTGRDIVEDERALRFDRGIWVEMGSAEEWQRTKEEQQLLDLFDSPDVVEDHDGVPVLTPKAVAAALDITDEAARQRLSRMERRGKLRKVGRGQYARAETRSQPSQRHELDSPHDDERDNVTGVTGFPATPDAIAGGGHPDDKPPASIAHALGNVMEMFPGAEMVDD